MKAIIFLSIAVFFAHSIVGQEGDVYSGSTDKTRSVARSEKLSAMPQSSDSIIQIPPVKYYLEPVKHEVSFETQPISPANLKVVEPLEKLYSGYVKAGVGNYTMPYLEAYYNSTRSKKASWGIDGLHHSAFGNIKDVGVNQFNDNHVGGYYKQFFKHFNWETALSYDRNSFHYYGFQSNDTLIPESYRNDEDTTSQVYNLVSFKTTLKSMFTDSNKINHTVNLRYNYLSAKTGMNEHNVLAEGNLFKYMRNEEIGADIALDVNAINQPFMRTVMDTTSIFPESVTYANTIFKFNPYIYSRGDNWSVRAGLNLQADIDDVSKFRFYPNLEANYSLFNNIFIPYVGANGGIQRNSFNSLRLKNPYITENTTLLNTNTKLKVFGGIRGSVSSKIAFNVSVSHEVLETLPLFVLDSLYSYENKFKVVYDSLSKTTIKGQLSYQSAEKMKLFLKGEYFAYSMGHQDYAWNLPDWKLTLSGTYDLADKIIVRLNIFAIGNRKSISMHPVEGITPNAGQYVYDVKPFVDASLGFEYRYNKKLSAFLNFNNVVSKKYQQWANYPVQSFNVLGGITYSF